MVKANVVDLYLRPMAEASGIFFIILGCVWIVDLLYELSRRGGIKPTSFFKLPERGFGFDNQKRLLKFLSMTVCGTGILFICVGVLGLVLSVAPIYAFVVLIVIGVLTHYKPLNDIPMATILGLLAATIVGIIMVSIVGVAAIYFGVRVSALMVTIMIVILIVIFGIVALIAKFWLAPWQLVSKIVSLPGISLIVSIYCIAQGIYILIIYGM